MNASGKEDMNVARFLLQDGKAWVKSELKRRVLAEFYLRGNGGKASS